MLAWWYSEVKTCSYIDIIKIVLGVIWSFVYSYSMEPGILNYTLPWAIPKHTQPDVGNMQDDSSNHITYFVSSDVHVLWSSHHIFPLSAQISIIGGLATATPPWMLELWSSHWTVFVEPRWILMNIESCCHLCCSSSMIYRLKPLQCMAFHFT